MERREDDYSSRPWQWLPDDGQFIVDARGNTVAEVPCQGCNPKDGELIVRAVNEHTTLTKQRDRLARVLRSILDGPARVVPVGKFEVWDEARDALATIEQPSPSTTGDEQGGGEL